MNDINETQRARAKRSDIDAMQKRFDAIVHVMSGWVDAGGDLPLSQAGTVYNIARGASLDDIINEAGRKALGLES